MKPRSNNLAPDGTDLSLSARPEMPQRRKIRAFLQEAGQNSARTPLLLTIK
jgi:hypothetical protein